MENTKIVEYIESSNPPSAPQIQWEELRRLMDFQELSYPSLAKISGTPESTLRKLLQGITKDPRISTMYPIVKALGASFDRLLGLAPKRDFEREEAHYDVTVMDAMRHNIESMQHRLDDKRTRIEELEKQLDVSEKDRDRLRKIVLEKGEALSESRARAAAAEQLVSERDGSIARHTQRYGEAIASHKDTIAELKAERNRSRRLLIVIVVMAFVIVGICALYVWDAANLHKGLTALLN